MSDLRKAAEMALDALHNIDQSNNYDAIEALREALAQPDEVLAEREACAKLCEEVLEPWLLREYIDKTVDAIRARGEK